MRMEETFEDMSEDLCKRVLDHLNAAIAAFRFTTLASGVMHPHEHYTHTHIHIYTYISEH